MDDGESRLAFLVLLAAASRDDDKTMQNGSCEIYDEDELAKHMLDEFLLEENLVLL